MTIVLLVVVHLFSFEYCCSKIRVLMGCGPSKPEDLPLIAFCKHRKDLIKSASNHRFALATAHFAYFRQLKDVGDSLSRFVEEELILSSNSSSPSSPSSLSSPVLTLPSDQASFKNFNLNNIHNNNNTNNNNNKFKKKKMKQKNKNKKIKESSSSTSISHNLRDDDQHLHLSSSSNDGGSGGGDSSMSHGHSSSGHLDIHDEDEEDDEDDEDENEEVGDGQSREKVKSPQPGISYIPESSQFPNSNNFPSYPLYNDLDSSSNSYTPNRYYYPPNYNYNDNNGGNVPPYYYGNPNPNFNSYYYPENGGYNGSNNVYGSTSYTTYYMKKSSTKIPSVIYEEPQQNVVYSISGNSPGQSAYPGYPVYGYGMNTDYRGGNNVGQAQAQVQRRPPTPPSPKVSAWDYFNPFESVEGGGYSSYYGVGGYGYGSNTSSPDSREVREREGIPELEEETESEVMKEPYYYDGKKKVKEQEFSFPKSGKKTVQFEDEMGMNKRRNGGFDEGTSKGVGVGVRLPPQREDEPMAEYVAVPEVEKVEVSDVRESGSVVSSPETEGSIATSVEDVFVKKKGVSFELNGSGSGNGGGGGSGSGGGGGGGGASSRDIESSKLSSTTTLSTHGTRDLREVVREIKDEFEAATDYGNEVSVLLEVGKEPYKSRPTFLKVILSWICSSSYSYSPTLLSEGHPEENFNSRSLASTLEKLYVWEKKLYKEVKDEERLRVMYEKQCKKLKTLDDNGAESNKIEATQASIRKLLTRINVSVRAVDSISRRIHKLRDEELQPQMKELIYGLRKMWKLMLKCHQKQYQAILDSKNRTLKANIGLRRDSSVRATIQLEAELLKWCHRFNNWIEMQKSYADTLNEWLEKCIDYEPEVTPDGIVPFSPARIGAPPVFVICHDWKQAMERVSGSEVQTAMHDFATSLHQLWERQDEEQRRRVKAENMYKDFEKQIRGIRMDKPRRGHDHDDSISDKNSLSLVASESGISPLDDLKVDLDSMRQRVREERAGHKEVVKLVHDAASRTIKAGLIPIFESLENFTLEASKAFDDVRLEHNTGK